MSGFIKKLGKLLPFGRNKPVGYDLKGNRFYEWPNAAGGRPRRSVEYKIERDIADYQAQEKLPVQWTSWLSHTRREPPTLEELEHDQQRLYRLAYNVSQITVRDAEESDRRKLLSGPTESADVDASVRRHLPSSEQPVDRPSSWQHGDPSRSYSQESPASNDPNAYVSPGAKERQRDQADPNAPVDSDLRAKSQKDMEMARRRMEVSKSPLSGFVPIDPSHAERAGRVNSDAVKGDERRGDTDATSDPGVVIPKPRRRSGVDKGAVAPKMDVDQAELARRGRVDATRKSEVQDVQAAGEEEIRRKAEELENVK